jgi:hypothetical protein
MTDPKPNPWRCVHAREMMQQTNPPRLLCWDCNLLRLPCCGFDHCALEQKRQRPEKKERGA